MNKKIDLKNKKVDVNLFLQTIVPYNFTIKSEEYNIKTIFPSKINLFMPNQEIFSSFNELNLCDYNMLNYSVQYMNKLHNFSINLELKDISSCFEIEKVKHGMLNRWHRTKELEWITV